MLQLLLTPSIRPPRSAVLPRSAAAPSMNQFADPWMNQLGRNTNSKEKWALPMAPESLGPGSIIMAEPGNFDHYFLESLVLIVQHDDKGTKGVLLNHGTPWTVEDLSPGALEPFAASKVFLGGDAGRDTMVMVHGEDMLPGAEEIGNGAYKGGVGSAVKAVAAGALPAERFKFFYKSVEFLPNALALQIDSGVFRVIDLSPAWLFGPSGQRSMWQDVLTKIEKAEAKELKAKGITAAPPSEDNLVTGAVNPNAPPRGLPYEGAGLAEEASKAAAKMRQDKEKSQKDNTDPPTDAEMEEDRVRSKAATLAHDAKVRAFVENIKKKNAEKWPEGRPEAEGATGATGAVPVAYDAGAMAGGTLEEVKAAEDERDRAETFTVGEAPTPEAAVEATNWLASQGIAAPPRSDGGGAGGIGCVAVVPA
mmetsp:Transcript_74595/g.180316  ORF Transcript_74595/g.180316 Transcript_74595/m.180316 type:complete len:421 (+) Transcript_74595:81-1343(+)